MRIFRDDLPCVLVSRLRASAAAITAETTSTVVRLGGLETVIPVTLQKFPNGGSWSLFIAPCCGRKARALWLLGGDVLGRRCCVSQHIRPRADPMGLSRRAAHRVPKLLARLQSQESARLRPRPGRTMDRRANLEIALRRSMLAVRVARLKRVDSPSTR